MTASSCPAMPSSALTKQLPSSSALMPPPPPPKRIKRPAKVLDEDEYTKALSWIIARDYFPGLYVSQMKRAEIDTSTLSLSAFQAKYTSEDNESFNALLDEQNAKRRAKHAHLWAPDQCIPSARQIAYRNREARLLTQKAEAEAAGKAVVPLTAGGSEGANRPARPDSWKIKRPNNPFMFPANSVDEDGLETVAEARERASRAGPRGVVHVNTRLPAPALKADESSIPPSPSLSAIRDAIAGRPRLSASEIETEAGCAGDETPRVNGYAFVDEDEPGNGTHAPQGADDATAPTYRDLLAGQVGDGTPNPFRIGEVRKREGLHHRLVGRAKRKKTLGQQAPLLLQRHGGRINDVSVPKFLSSPLVGPGLRGKAGTEVGNGGRGAGGLTPAAKRMLDRVVARTPVGATTNASGGGGGGGGQGIERSGPRNTSTMWTPTSTPKRKVRA